MELAKEVSAMMKTHSKRIAQAAVLGIALGLAVGPSASAAVIVPIPVVPSPSIVMPEPQLPLFPTSPTISKVVKLSMDNGRIAVLRVGDWRTMRLPSAYALSL